MLVIGAGVMGLELGSIYQGLGSEVTFVDTADKIIPYFDHEVCAYMHKLFSKEGFKFLLGHQVLSSEVRDHSAKVVLEEIASKKKTEFEADIVLVTAGRKPFTAGLARDKIGLSMEKNGRIAVNDNLQVIVLYYR